MSFWERLDRYIRRGPGSMKRPFELLPRQEFDAAVTSAMTDRLGEGGFEDTGKRRWTRQNAPAIIGLVELQALKSELVPAWGVSLDFVPHLKGSEIAWHRTPKSARLDLSYQPLDYEEDVRPWKMSQFTTREELPQESRRFASRVSDAVARFLQPLTSVEAVLEALEAKRVRRYIRLGFEHYPQEMLAYAFVSARVGKRNEAVEALSAFVRQHRVADEVAADLSRLLANMSVEAK